MTLLRQLNSDGKILFFCCLLNLFISIKLALAGSWFALVPFFCSMFCGLYTLDKKYKK